MANLYNVPLKNAVQKVLQNTLNSGETSTITFTTSVTSDLQASASIPGILVIDRVDVNGTLTPSLTEYISFTGVSGSTVTGLTRALGGTTAQDHAIGAIVEFVPDVVWADAINDVFTNQHNADGTHKSLSSLAISNTVIVGASLASVTLSNYSFGGGALASISITNSTLDTATFKSLFSNVTQGDLITYNAGNFERLSAVSINHVLAVGSTASGLLPRFIEPLRYYSSRVSTSVVTANAYTDIPNSTITVTLNSTSNVFVNYSFGYQNNTGNRFANIKLLRDASDLRDVSYIAGAAGTGTGVVNGYYLDSNLAAGTYVYKFQIKNSTTGDQVAAVGYTNSDIVIETRPA